MKQKRYSAKIEFRERPEKKAAIQKIADQRGLDLPDIMREATALYLERYQKKKQSAA